MYIDNYSVFRIIFVLNAITFVTFIVDFFWFVTINASASIQAFFAFIMTILMHGFTEIIN